MLSWALMDTDTLAALEPVLMRIVSSASSGAMGSYYRDVRTLLSEKYEYIRETRSIRSCDFLPHSFIKCH